MKKYKVIDMSNDPRRSHFEYFSKMADPYLGVTVQVTVDGFVQHCKENHHPFFLSFLYCIGQAANEIPELRRRISGEQVIEFESCDTSHTVMRDNDTYAYCRLNTMQPFESYIAQAMVSQEQAKQSGTLDEEGDPISLLFISSMPWLHYTALVQPTPRPADSNPRIIWGRYASVNGRLVMPVTLLVNHALVDGLHVARFYAALERRIDEFVKANMKSSAE